MLNGPLAKAAALAVSVSVLVLSSATAFAQDGGDALDDAAARPNIVVIMTDDQRVDDLYATVGGRPLMPNARKLIGGKGVTFTRNYSSYSLSCPSRSTFLTGQYAHNHGITANKFPSGPYCGSPGIFDVQNSLGLWLQAAGYRTMIAGRYLNAWPAPATNPRELTAPGWDRWYVAVPVQPVQAALFYEYYLNENGTVTPPVPHLLKEDSNYFTDVIHERIHESIRATPSDQPVFAWIAHRPPHEDVVAPEGPEPAERHQLLAEAIELPRYLAFDERSYGDKPSFLREQPRVVFGERRQIDLRWRRRLASLASADEQIAELVETLRETGRLDNTYLVFTSDNGFLNGEHRLPKGKIRPYEESTRIPLMIAGPGIAEGEVSSELVSNVDLAPTLLELSGARPTHPLDGRSLMPFATDPAKRTGRPLLLQSFRDDSEDSVGTNIRVQVPPYRALVHGRYKFVVHKNGEGELYDLERDPLELDNAYDAPAYAAVRAYFAPILERLRRCAAKACRIEIGEAPPPAGPLPTKPEPRDKKYQGE